MQCAHCGQAQTGVCLDCDSHLFQVGMTLRNESAPILLKQRQQDADKKKKDDEIKKLKKQVFRCKFVLVLTIPASLLYWGTKHYPPRPEPCAQQKTTITRPIPFNSEELLEPGEIVFGDFPIEEYRHVTINVTAECKNYVEGSLRISLLDEYNYRLLESGQPHDEIDTIGATSYLATRALDRGHYYIVLQNTSEIQEIVVKVKASLSYTQADMTPCSQAAPAPCPDLNSKP